LLIIAGAFDEMVIILSRTSAQLKEAASLQADPPALPKVELSKREIADLRKRLDPATSPARRRQLADLTPGQLVVLAILRAAAEEFGVPLAEILSESRERYVVDARHAAMWALRQHVELSYPDIGQIFNGRDHTTAMNAVRRVEGKVSEPACDWPERMARIMRRAQATAASSL
jgi:hypothetical protein